MDSETMGGVPYQLDQLDNEVDNQPKLSAFFTKNNISISDNTTTSSTVQATSRVGSPLSYSGSFEDPISFEELQSAEDLEPCALESKDLMQASYNVDRAEDSSGSMAMQELSDTAASGDGSHAPFPAPSSPHNEASAYRDWMSDPVNTGPSNLKIPRSPNQRHSTLVDANFVENYFKLLHCITNTYPSELTHWYVIANQIIKASSAKVIDMFFVGFCLQHSRLHFIGTLRNKYRKRSPSSPGVFRCTSFGPSSSATANKTIIIHVDMDCFFVSMVIRNHPELKDKPVAICHSDNPRGTAEISSANYPAKGYGVKAGMFVRDAKSRCLHLVILSYDFEAYEEAISCDEAFLDATDAGVEDSQAFVCVIREDILDATGCTASAGIAGNMLMARLATRIAKPDGQCYIPSEKAKYWKQYVEAHMAVNNDDATKQIFSRCLLNCLQIPLCSHILVWDGVGTLEFLGIFNPFHLHVTWRCYIRFIRKVNDKRGNEGQEETRKAFDFMLNYVGLRRQLKYEMLHSEIEVSNSAQTTQEESQRMTSVRKTYQRAIVTPTHHVEQLWRDYENFENSISRPLAKGLISEYQPKYNSARAVYRERKKYIDEIDWNMLAIPPSGSSKAIPSVSFIVLHLKQAN
ncbi:Cleavage stimulation factor subunit 77 [Capsicum chinense]|nr:Cleavage stimulation factor subunit 77 [Capsicum chinense]